MPSYADISDFGSYFSSAEEAAQKAAKNNRKAQEEEAERQYFSTTEQLGSTERGLRADQPLVEEGILTSIEREKLPIYQGKEESLAQLGINARDLRESTRSGISTASRTFNELATAIPQYAGTSVGGAVGEIIGRQTARDIGGLTKKQQTGLFDIGNEKNRVIKFATDKVAAIEATGQNLLRKAKQDFLNNIDKINTLRRVAENDKNSMRKQALYGYQSSISEIQTNIQSQKFALNRWAYEKNLDMRNAEEARLRVEQEKANQTDWIRKYMEGPQSTAVPGGTQTIGNINYSGNADGTWSPQQQTQQSNNFGGGISFDGANSSGTLTLGNSIFGEDY